MHNYNFAHSFVGGGGETWNEALRGAYKNIDWPETPFQTQYFSENPVALRIEPRASGSVGRNSDH
jgi:hypothetical protein